MPVHRGTDSFGKCYYQWGKSGKKYYYEKGNSKSRTEAKNKASKQGYAVRFRQRVSNRELNS